MKRFFELLALAGIAATVGVLCEGLTIAEPPVRGGLSMELDWIATAMQQKGIRRRTDVVIEIDAVEVAAGFSRPDCDGLLLFVPLPHTAQGWGHIAPRLDLSGFVVHYVYGGALHADVPRFQRLGDRLIAELRPNSGSSRPRLAALAEAGSCDLAVSVETALMDYSRGGDRSARGAEDA